MRNLVLYHGDCNDGFGSAWAIAKSKYNYDLGLNSYEFIPVAYGKPYPDLTDVNQLLMVDFSYPLNTILEMGEKVKNIFIIDHHKTAQENLKQFIITDLTSKSEKITAIFDMNKSGAMLTWEHFNSSKSAPSLIKYLQAYDLWQHDSLPFVKEVNAYTSSFLHTFQNYDGIAERLENDFANLVAEGAGIYRQKMRDVERLIKHPCLMKIRGYLVPVISAPYFHASECGNILSKDRPFAASFFLDEKGGYGFSLRSQREGGIDVSEIAKSFGGGGHKNAAGFRVTSLEELA